MPYRLHVRGEPPKALRWTVHDSRSSYGAGVLLFARTSNVLDGATFRRLRDHHGAWLETDRPDRARSALALFEDESLGGENV